MSGAARLRGGQAVADDGPQAGRRRGPRPRHTRRQVIAAETGRDDCGVSSDDHKHKRQRCAEDSQALMKIHAMPRHQDYLREENADPRKHHQAMRAH